MIQEEKNKQEEQDIIEEIQEEILDIEDSEWEIDEEKLEDVVSGKSDFDKLKDTLMRTTADFENFKTRTQRDRQDMIFFLKSDIFKKILPRIDDLERMIKNTPENMQSGALYEGILAVEKNIKKDMSDLGVESFSSLWEEVDPNKHDVMTQVLGKPEGIICDEFEAWYMLWDKVLRHAKVVVGSWE